MREKTKKFPPTYFIVFADVVLGIIFVFLLSTVIHLQLLDKSSIDKALFNKEAKVIADNCLKKNRKECYEDSFRQIAQSSGFAAAEQTLYALWEIDPFTRSCHVLAHIISEAATRRDPTSWKKLLNSVDVNACGSGFLHGILEAHVSSDPDFVIDAKAINQLCSTVEYDRRTMCSHMMAHILLLHNDGKMDESYAICDSVNEELKFQCFDGLFMEDHQKNIMSDHGLAKAPDYTDSYVQKLIKRCNLLDGIKSTACWTEMGEIFAKANNYSQEKVFEGCTQANLEEDETQCYLKGVIILVTYPVYNSLERIKNLCIPYNTDYKLLKTCLHYGVSALMNYSVKFADRGIFLCKNTKDELKEYCFKDLGEQLAMKSELLTERKDLCLDAPDEYKHLCEKP